MHISYISLAAIFTVLRASHTIPGLPTVLRLKLTNGLIVILTDGLPVYDAVEILPRDSLPPYETDLLEHYGTPC